MIKESHTFTTEYVDMLSPQTREQVIRAILNDSQTGIGDAKELIRKEIKKEVLSIFQPYVKSESIINYMPSVKQYRARIPKALRIPGMPEKVCSKTEEECLMKLYKLLTAPQFSQNTVRKLFHEWHKNRIEDPDITSKTSDLDDLIFRKYIEGSSIVDTDITAITASDILRFYKGITNGNFNVIDKYVRGKTSATRKFSEIHPEITNRAITRTELNNCKSTLNGVWDLAIEKGIVSVNIPRNVNTSKLKCKDKIDHTMDVYDSSDREQIILYCLQVKGIDEIYSLAIAFMFCLDCRIGELAALRWSDINSKGKIGIFREVVTRKVDGKRTLIEKKHTKIGEGGGRWQRLTVLSSLILERLRPLTYSENGLLFPGCTGTYLRFTTFNRNLKRTCEAVGVPYYSSHKIRFSAVSRLYQAGADIQAIKALSGHKELSTTMHYMRNVADSAETNAIWEKTFSCSDELMAKIKSGTT